MEFFKKILITMTLLFSCSAFAANADPDEIKVEDLGIASCNAMQVLGIKADQFENINQQELDNACSARNEIGDFTLNIYNYVYTGLMMLFLYYILYWTYSKWTNKYFKPQEKDVLFGLAMSLASAILVFTPVKSKDSQGNDITYSLGTYITAHYKIKDFLNADSMVQDNDLLVYDKVILKADENYRTDDFKSFTVSLLPYFAKQNLKGQSFDYNIYDNNSRIFADFIIGFGRFYVQYKKDNDLANVGSAKNSDTNSLGIDFSGLEKTTQVREIKNIVENGIKTAIFITNTYTKGNDTIPQFKELNGLDELKTFANQSGNCELVNSDAFDLRGVQYKELNKYLTFVSYCNSKTMYDEGFTDRVFITNDEADSSLVEAGTIISEIKSICRKSLYECAATLRYGTYVNDVKNKSSGIISLITEPYLNEQKNIAISTNESVSRLMTGSFVSPSETMGDYRVSGVSAYKQTITFPDDMRTNDDLGFMFSLGVSEAYDLYDSGSAFIDNMKTLDEYGKSIMQSTYRPMMNFKYCIDYPNMKMQIGEDYLVNSSGSGCLSELRRTTKEAAFAIDTGLMASKATKNSAVSKTVISSTKSIGKVVGDKVSDILGAVLFFYGISDDSFDAFNTGTNSFMNSYTTAYAAYKLSSIETGRNFLSLFSTGFNAMYYMSTAIIFLIPVILIIKLVNAVKDAIIINTFGIFIIRNESKPMELLDIMKYLFLISSLSVSMVVLGMLILTDLREQLIMFVFSYVELPDFAELKGFGDLVGVAGRMVNLLITMMVLLTFQTMYFLKVFSNMLENTIFKSNAQTADAVSDQNMLNNKKGLMKKGVHMGA